MNNYKKWLWIWIVASIFLSVPSVFAKKIAKPYWTVGPLKKSTLTLKNGNLDCSPYNCQIPLKPGQTFKKVQPHIFALMEHGNINQYFFFSTDFVKFPGYSGDPMAMELSISPNNFIKFVRLIAMNEPIFIEGIPILDLTKALNKYINVNITNFRKYKPHPGKKGERRERVENGQHPGGKRKSFKNHSNGVKVKTDIITGATVTSHVAEQTVFASAHMVGVRVGTIKKVTTRKVTINQNFQSLTWKELLNMGAIGHLKVMPQEMGLPKSDTPWVDIYFANVSVPIIGRNLLGDTRFFAIKKALKPQEPLILVINNGSWSFKGSAFARGGIFDRFSIKQNANTYTFRDTDYYVLYGTIAAKGAPPYKETGMFKLAASNFQVGNTWQFILMSSRLTGKTAVSKMYKNFSASYTLPPSFYTAKITNIVGAGIQKISFLTKLWKSDWLAVSWYIILWLFVIGIFTFKGYLARRKKVIDIVHFGVLITSFITVGIYQHGQPSVVNITTFVNVIVHQSSWNIYLRDPFLFVGWILIVLTVATWGRTLFCGWICPFGAMQEIVFKLRTWLTPFKKSYDFPAKIQSKIKYLSYVIFLMIFIISIFSFQMSEIVADKVEPFKTIWNVGILHRPIGYGLYIAILVILGVFSYRFFCRYMCPLGGGLALLSLFPLWRIKRRNTCNACRICATDCPALAITKKGQIDMKGCFGYFACITNMYNKKRCPPLLSKKLWTKNKEKDIKFP